MTVAALINLAESVVVALAGQYGVALLGEARRGLLPGGRLGVELRLDVLEPRDEGEFVVALCLVAKVAPFEVELRFLVVVRILPLCLIRPILCIALIGS